VLLGDEPVLSTEAKLYQRLLARDLDEAWAIVEKELQDKPTVEVYDRVLIPALAFAERERHEGSLDRGTFDAVAESMAQIVDEADDVRREPKVEKEGKEGKVATEGTEANGAVEPKDAASKPLLEAAVQFPVLCVAAEDEADRVGALMAEKLLRRMGLLPEVLSAATLTGELPKLVEDRRAPIVFISNFPPSGFAQVRYISKRLAGKSDDLHVIVGIWGSAEDAHKLRDRLPSRSSFYVVSSLAEALERVRELAESLNLARTGGARADPERKPNAKVQAPRVAL
jgi:hypothetical protein